MLPDCELCRGTKIFCVVEDEVYCTRCLVYVAQVDNHFRLFSHTRVCLSRFNWLDVCFCDIPDHEDSDDDCDRPRSLRYRARNRA